MEEFTQEQIVAIEGDEVIKNHLAKNGRLMTNVFKRFVKDLEQRYEHVEVIGKGGKKTKYILGKKREQIAEREDNRISNGAWSNPYTKNMDIMVVSVLEQGLEAETAQTLSKWALDFGLITPKMYELLLARYNDYLKSEHIQDLKDNNIIRKGEDRIVDDFTYMTKEITNQLASTLNRMEKAGIIEYYPVYKGHVKETDKKISLHETTVKKILTLQRELMEKYDVNEWYLAHYKNSKKTVQYYKEWKEGLAEITDEDGNVLGLDYWYKTYAIILKARKKKIIRYLEIYNKEAIERFKQNEELFLTDNETTYHKERHDYVVKEAQDKENKFLSKKTKTYTLNENLQEIYGTETLTKTVYNERENFTFDEGYYALYFDRLYAERIKKLQEYYGYTFK
jgi:hypothetical protein